MKKFLFLLIIVSPGFAMETDSKKMVTAIYCKAKAEATVNAAAFIDDIAIQIDLLHHLDEGMKGCYSFHQSSVYDLKNQDEKFIAFTIRGMIKKNYLCCAIETNHRYIETFDHEDVASYIQRLPCVEHVFASEEEFLSDGNPTKQELVKSHKKELKKYSR